MVLSLHIHLQASQRFTTRGVEYFNNQPIYAKIVEMGANVKIIEQSDFHYDARKKLATALINITQNGADIDSEIKTAEDDLKFTMGL